MMQNLNYLIENNIVCVFDASRWESSKLRELTLLAKDIVNAEGFLFQTSGSTSHPKFVLHSKTSLEACAQACQYWLHLQSEDRWMNVLSPFHMGGFSTYFRSQVLGLQPVFTCSWESEGLLESFERQGCTLLSLVPAQVFELVQNRLAAPKNIKAVLVGGGALDPLVKLEAQKLGWPILGSLGSTETGSQVFTELLDGSKEGLWALPHFEVKVDKDDRLQIKGEGLFSTYIHFDQTQKHFQVEPIQKDQNGFWTSSDRVEIKGRRLVRFIGRSSDEIKVLGYLVDVFQVRKQFSEWLKAYEFEPEDYFIDALPDGKSGNQLALFKTNFNPILKKAVTDWNESKSPHERIVAQYFVDQIPRSNIGKVLSFKLKDKFNL